jgi:hypothetical protein
VISVAGSVTLTGEPAREFRVGPWEYAQWEQYSARKGLTTETAPVTFAMYLAYCATHRDPWPPEVGYDVWAQGVVDVQLEDGEEVRPTEKEALAG